MEDGQFTEGLLLIFGIAVISGIYCLICNVFRDKDK